VAVAEAEPGAGREDEDEDEDEDDDATIGRDEKKQQQQQGRPLDREIWIAGCCCCCGSMLIKTLFGWMRPTFIICSSFAAAAVVNGNNDARIRGCMVRARRVWWKFLSREEIGWGCACVACVRVHRCSWRRRTGAGSSVAEGSGVRPSGLFCF
jgi:hypothetical protein